MERRIDCITVNGETELIELRLWMLNGVVDEFVIVEFDQTFSGKPKEWTFDIDNPRFSSFKDKIRVVHFTEQDWLKYEELAYQSPNTQGADHWKREFMQKECIKDALSYLNDTDTVFIGDADEIWEPTLGIPNYPVKLKLRVYTYFLNNRSSEQFWGTLAAPWKDIKDTCLNHLRTTAPGTEEYAGWHFTSMAFSLAKKLTDSYTQETYASAQILENLAYNIEHTRDFLGRDFSYSLDESEWPQFLKDNKERYAKLIRGITGEESCKTKEMAREQSGTLATA